MLGQIIQWAAGKPYFRIAYHDARRLELVAPQELDDLLQWHLVLQPQGDQARDDFNKCPRFGARLVRVDEHAADDVICISPYIHVERASAQFDTLTDCLVAIGEAMAFH